MGEWKAILEDEIGRTDTPVKGTHPHPSERHIDGSHTSDVTSHIDSGKGADGDTSLEDDAMEPLPRSGQYKDSIDGEKKTGVSMGYTPLFRVGGDLSSGSREDDGPKEPPMKVQKGKDLFKESLLQPPTSGNADLQSPSSGHQYTPPKGSFLQQSFKFKDVNTKKSELLSHTFTSMMDLYLSQPSGRIT
jgi:hypothetical protein